MSAQLNKMAEYTKGQGQINVSDIQYHLVGACTTYLCKKNKEK